MLSNDIVLEKILDMGRRGNLVWGVEMWNVVHHLRVHMGLCHNTHFHNGHILQLINSNSNYLYHNRNLESKLALLELFLSCLDTN